MSANLESKLEKSKQEIESTIQPFIDIYGKSFTGLFSLFHAYSHINFNDYKPANGEISLDDMMRMFSMI